MLVRLQTRPACPLGHDPAAELLTPEQRLLGRCTRSTRTSDSSQQVYGTE
ncbi:hypothetical protein [Streptomyces sp. NRRL B-24484]|nr:hypothetical protein [Streptomyces sp. NRRL B-24484]